MAAGPRFPAKTIVIIKREVKGTVKWVPGTHVREQYGIHDNHCQVRRVKLKTTHSSERIKQRKT